MKGRAEGVKQCRDMLKQYTAVKVNEVIKTGIEGQKLKDEDSDEDWKPRITELFNAMHVRQFMGLERNRRPSLEKVLRDNPGKLKLVFEDRLRTCDSNIPNELKPKFTLYLNSEPSELKVGDSKAGVKSGKEFKDENENNRFTFASTSIDSSKDAAKQENMKVFESKPKVLNSKVQDSRRDFDIKDEATTSVFDSTPVKNDRNKSDLDSAQSVFESSASNNINKQTINNIPNLFGGSLFENPFNSGGFSSSIQDSIVNDSSGGEEDAAAEKISGFNSMFIGAVTKGRNEQNKTRINPRRTELN